MPAEPKRKPRAAPAPYNRTKKPGPKPKAQTHKSSAKPPLQAKDKRDNLTYGDWLEVFAWVDNHPDASQTATVKYFATRATGPLVFTQATLSRKLKSRETIEDRARANPTAMSAKRPRVVTRPDVERALVLWQCQMESKGNTVNRAMLLEKRSRFKEEFKVPDEERVKGEGWIASFCQTYGIKEIRRHGEAGSVDVAAVEVERVRVQALIKEFGLKNTLNFDESAFFAYAPPDRGLATTQMSGLKQEKFRITIAFLCSAAGEKGEIFFIGRSKQPRCFKKKTPKARGFLYRNNKKAWMTGELFEEWLKSLDSRMRRENRKVLLLIDNFAGHTVSYQPKNIRVEFFAPNMTSFIQPLDQGVIRTFKAHYRRSFAIKALDADEAGEPNIWKTNLLEAMCMARDSWATVSVETIKNCWRHAGILPETDTAPPPDLSSAPSLLDDGWALVLRYASDSSVDLAWAEHSLRALFGEQYDDGTWRPALNAVVDSEDSATALDAVNRLRGRSAAGTAVSGSAPTGTAAASVPSELAAAEAALVAELQELTKRNLVKAANIPTLDELLDPPQERVIGGPPELFATDAEIVAAVRREQQSADTSVVDIDSDSGDEDEKGESSKVSLSAQIALMDQVELLCRTNGYDNMVNLTTELRKAKGDLRRQLLAEASQTNITAYFHKKNPQ